MAPAETTTLRVPIALRDEIAHIAHQRGSTMLEVVTDAVHRLRRDEWWLAVQVALDASKSDVEAHAETRILDHASSDGLDVG